jgi:hypothetical protein
MGPGFRRESEEDLLIASWATVCWIGAENWSEPHRGFTVIVLRTNQASPN